jgi:hypothetical protein
VSGVAALAGGVAMAFALVVAYLVSVTGVPFAPISLGQAIIEALPGWISVPLIELLEFWAQRLLVLGVLALFLGTGALTGALASDRRAPTSMVVATGAAPWVASVVLGQLLAGHRIDLGADLFGAGIGAAAFLGSLAFVLSAERVASPASASRRRALLGGVAVAGVLAVGSLALGIGCVSWW